MLQSNNYAATAQFDLLEVLNQISTVLPSQGPIKDFIHHNTLSAFQYLPFHNAIAVASELYGSKDYLALEEYRSLYRKKRISDEAILKSLNRFGVLDSQKEQFKNRLLNEICLDDAAHGQAINGIRTIWAKERGVNLNRLIQPLLFKLVSNYLDQGISIWRMPHATQTFYKAITNLVNESLLPLIPLSDPVCRTLLSKDPLEACLIALNKICKDVSHFEDYLLEIHLSHPGWSGMVSMIEEDPASLISFRKISLLEFTAIELVMEIGWLTRVLGDNFAPLNLENRKPLLPVHRRLPSPNPTRDLKRIWHEALEFTQYGEFLTRLKDTKPKQNIIKRPSVQAFFCLDDRCCSLRRHLEEVKEDLATYGTAGFFGIDFLFQGADSDRIVRYCPVGITPKHVVRELRTNDASANKRWHFSQLIQFNPETHTLFRGWLLTQTIGIAASIRLALKIFLPGSFLLVESSLTRIDKSTKLSLIRSSDEEVKDGYLIGYSVAEMVERVYGVLISVGLYDSFSRLIVFFGHGSTSANNPHFAAYDCGACAGKPGAPNARAIAWMANHAEVRKQLLQKGIVLPDDCYFIGAIFDTARDEVAYFDLEHLPKSHETEFKNFESAIKEALKRNALERCQSFELRPKDLSTDTALEHVQKRSSSIFEPRPEMNHANNAFCVIGRRSLTRSLFLGRRAFLNSYDPTQDTSGKLLSSILAAVIPVCAGINLEYFFSRIDNEVYGAGTKLPHNVVSLLGVANGVEGDLRTGLPSQMIEIHDPVRLFILVEQEPDLALSAAKTIPGIFEFIENEWVIFGCQSISDKKFYYFKEGHMVPFFEDFKSLSPTTKTISSTGDSL